MHATTPSPTDRLLQPPVRRLRARGSKLGTTLRATVMVSAVMVSTVMVSAVMVSAAQADRGTDQRAAQGPEAINASRVEDYYETYRPGPLTFERWLSFYHPQVSFRDPTYSAKADDREALRKIGQQAGLDTVVEKGGLRWNLHRRFFDDEQVVVTGTYSGLYNEKPYDVRFITWLTMQEGLIVEQLDIADTTTFMEQAGLGSPPGGQPAVTARVAKVPASARPLERDEAEKMVARYVGVYQAPRIDLDRFLHFYADDARFIDPTFRIDLEGREAIGAMMRGAIESGFATLRFTIDRIAVDGARVAFRGTLTGQYGGKPFTDIDFATIWTVVDGKIVDHLDFYDSREWMRQVGLLPAS